MLSWHAEGCRDGESEVIVASSIVRYRIEVQPLSSRDRVMQRFMSAFLLVTAAAIANADDWPAWRGELGTGLSDESEAPLKWSERENIKWRATLPGPGNSTPVVWEDRVFLTQATDEGKQRSLMCFDRATGQIIWQKHVHYERLEATHNTNPQCSASPVTDGEIVVAWHGSAGLFAYDVSGQELWKVDLGEFQHIWGWASSPMIYEDLVILNAGPGLRAFIVAVDKRTGKEVWRREPVEAVSEKVDQFYGSWSTPVLHEENGRTVLLVSLPHTLHAMDPRSGEELWTCDGLGDLVYASPIVGYGIVVAMSGYGGPSLAVRTGGTGDVTTTHRLWRNEARKLNPQRVGSGVVVGEHLYILNEPGIAWCMELMTGEVVWEHRLGKTWSSMCFAAGRLYVVDMEGTTYVLEPTPEECRVLAQNPVDELTRGSLAFSDGEIFLRTYETLYCIGN